MSACPAPCRRLTARFFVHHVHSGMIKAMTTDRTITLFHSPQCRSVSALTLLEELGAPYQLKVLNMKAGEQRKAPYLAINPLGKVPAILHGDALVTEQVAI